MTSGSAIDWHNWTPRHFAARNETEMAALVTASASFGGFSPYAIAITNQNETALATIVAAGTDLNARGWHETLCNVAVYVKNERTMAIPVVGGADANMPRNVLGQTPAELAALAGHVEVLAVLAAAGANLTTARVSFYTPYRGFPPGYEVKEQPTDIGLVTDSFRTQLSRLSFTYGTRRRRVSIGANSRLCGSDCGQEADRACWLCCDTCAPARGVRRPEAARSRRLRF